MKRRLLVLAVVIVLVTPAFAERIVCASTTSTQNSGLFDHILPLFKKETGIDVHVIAVGTGAALEMAKRGDADMVLVHAKDLELQGVKEGYFINRHDVPSPLHGQGPCQHPHVLPSQGQLPSLRR